MQIFRHLPQNRPHATVLAIGNFDGVHLGHQALLKQLVDTARANQQLAAVMTFEPHPRDYFAQKAGRPDDAPARLTSLREKLEYLADMGVDRVYVQHFDADMASVTSDAFMQQILRDRLNVVTVLVGDDFRFGAKRQGTVTDLVAHGFKLPGVPAVMAGEQRVSSTRVREALATGDLEQAKRLMGRYYSISGKVVYGKQLGRVLGFPTANVHMRHERPALTGVYAVKLQTEQGVVMNGVANLGVKPTVAGTPKLMLEVYVFDFDGNLYGQHVHVAFMHKIRDEQKFDGLDALKAQIAQDAAQARAYFLARNSA